ncbi:MAG: hypothetical protein FWD64_05505, partial [Acidobacteriaceae bacterium]|nr:hypothetical protein [Acidobacteriaceae bacterium]
GTFPLSQEVMSQTCNGECRIVFQSSIVQSAAKFAANDIIFVSGHLITGYIRDSKITTNKVMANYAVSVDKVGFSDCDVRNFIEISGVLGDDPVETMKPVHAWSVRLCPHLSPDLHPLRAPEKHQLRSYQVLFSEPVQDKVFQFARNNLVLVSGYFIPSCSCHPKTSANSIVASSITRLGSPHAVRQPADLPSLSR